MQNMINIPPENIKNKFIVNHSNSAISITDNGCFIIDTTKLFNVFPYTFNNITIFQLNSGKYFFSAIRQRVWGSAELIYYLENKTTMSKKEIRKSLDSLGVHESDYTIQEYIDNEFLEDIYDTMTGFYYPKNMIFFSPKFKSQKIISEIKNYINVECSNFSIIAEGDLQTIIEKI